MFGAWMDVILAWRFSPFDFFAIPSYPNPVPIVDDLGVCLPKLKDRKDENLVAHLLEFH